MQNNAAKDDYTRVKDDLSSLKEDLASLTKAVADSQVNHATTLKNEISKEARAVFEQLRQSGDEALNRATKAGSEAVDRASQAGSQAVESVEHKIEERPFLSIILMFLAGIVVGKMLDR